MHRIDGEGATPDGFFTEGDPVTGVNPTHVTDDWCNNVQEELCTVIEDASIALNKNSNTQLKSAIQSMIVGAQSVARYINKFNGTGAQTAFTLSVAPPSTLACTVWIGGAIKIPVDDFTVSGTTLTFGVAPASGTNNVVVLIEGTAQEVVSQFPVGAMMPYAGTSAPSGWLLANGAAVSRTTYAALFSLVGTSFGAGDGSTTFNLPDLRGRAWIGLDNLGGSSANRIVATEADTLGGAGGAETRTPTGTVGKTTLTINQIPVHAHNVNDATSKNGAAGGGGSVWSGNASVASSSAGGGQDHDHSWTGNSMNITQPWLALGAIIKY